MRKGKILTFLVATVYVLALLMSLVGISPLAVAAAENAGNKVTATTNATVKQGNTGYCYIYIDSLESLSSLNVAVHFDPDKISVTSSFNQVDCPLYDSSVGESHVQYSYIFDGNGEDVKTKLFYFEYKVLSNANVGETYFDIIVNEAYDSTLNVADVTGSRCSFSIAETVTTKTCSISGASSVNSSIDGEFELSYRLNTTAVASGSFVIRYDPELFAFVELTQGELLSNKFVDIKTDSPGAVYVSFVGTEYASNAQLLNIKFKTIKNTTETSQIKLSVVDFYDLMLDSISCQGYTTTAHITYDPLYSENAPVMDATAVYSAENNNVILTIKLDKNAHLGAGDFVLNFDTKYFTYHSSQKGFSPTFFNINDKKVAEGVLKFSIISLSDIVSEETVLTVVFDTPIFCDDVQAEFNLSGSGLADSMTDPIVLNFKGASLAIPGVGHDEIAHLAQDPTCTEVGWYAYDTCSRCDYTTYVEIPANGHHYIHTVCATCGSKQPAYKSWDVSAAGDGSLTANLYQNIVDGGYELEISGVGEMKDWSSSSQVPYNGYRAQINYLTLENGITSIGAYAFYGCSTLMEIEIPENVTSIGEYTFYNCTNLEKVNMPSSLNTIGTSAFCGCSSLTEIEIPESVTAIGNRAFYGCKALTQITFNAAALNDLASSNDAFYNAGVEGSGIKVTVGKNVTKIPAYLFYPYSNTSCSPKITEVEFEEGSVCNTIGTYAFYGCSTLTEIEIPESVTSIENHAFRDCKALTQITFNATALNDLASNNHVFYNAGIEGSGIRVTIGKNVTKIPAYLFYPYSNTSCSPKITQVVFEEGSVCNTIGTYAFYGCSSLTEIELPESVTSIGSSAFYDCKALTQITFNAAALNDLASNNYVFYNAGIEGSGIRVTIGKNVTKIPAYLFYPYSNTSCSPKITQVVFEEGSVCNTIGKYAFNGCSSLTEIEIPESVTSIGNSAFRVCTNLARVNIPSSLNIIGTYAFCGCSSLMEIELPESVTAIGEYTFYNCTNLEKVNMPSSLNTIGAYAFRGCSSLTEMEIPENVTSIGSSAFSGCSSLTEIEIPESITSIGSSAFSGCKALTQITFNATALNDLASGNYVFYNAGIEGSGIRVTIGKNVTKIPAYLFYPYSDTSCSPKITQVVFEEGSVCNTIGACAFYGCSSLTEIELPESVTAIGEHTFYNCTNLEKVNMPDSLNTIGAYAFRGCSSLTEMEIPENVTSIGSSAFYDCKALTQITFNAAALNDLASSNYVFYNAGIEGSGIRVTIGKNVTKIPAYLFYPCSNTSCLPKITQVVFEEGSACNTIGTYAFYGCITLTEMEIPENVTSIGNYAFYDCKALTQITFNATALNDLTNYNYVFYNAGIEGSGIRVVFGRNVTKIPAYLFYPHSNTSCSPKITQVVFEEGSACNTIGTYAFYGCSSLTEMEIPENVTSIGNYAFYDCKALTQITFNATALNDFVINNAVFFKAGTDGKGVSVIFGRNVTRIPAYLFYPYSNNDYVPKITSVMFEEGSVCETIGAYAFNGGRYLEQITFADTITQINANAFSGCSELIEIKLPENLEFIGNYVFYNCTNLEKVNMPDSLNTIGTYAFYGCSSLTEIEIPESMTSIGNRAFYDCKALTQITFNPTALNDLSSDNFVFYNAGIEGSGIKVTVGKNVTKIPAYLFYPHSNTSCSPKITQVVFEEGSVCNTIGTYAFYGCSSLTEIEIPESVTSIGNSAFYDCKALTQITFNAAALNDLASNNYVFYNAGIEGSGIRVTIGKNVTKIPAYLFYPYSGTSCSPKITQVVFEEGSVCNTIGTYAFNGCSSLTEIEIPESVTSIGNSAFRVCTNLARVNIPSSLNTIGTYAFCGCSSLTEIELPESVTAIGEYTFYNCTNLEKVNMPSSLNTIGAYAFYGCSSLTEIEIPENVTSIGSAAFSGCKALTQITFNATALNDLASNNYVFYNAGIEGSGIRVTIGKNVTKVPAYLFLPYSNITYSPKITQVVFEEDSVCNTIGTYAFAGCGNLTSVRMPSSLNTIGAYAFYMCSRLTEIEIPESVTAIGEYTFYNCTNLEKVNMPSSLNTIGAYAFYGCSSLTEIEIPENVTSIGSAAFSGCKALTQITFNATALNDLASNNYVFYNAGIEGSGIRVTIGKNVTKVPAYLFLPYSNITYSPKITQVVFEEDSVCNTIGTYAFAGCENLTSVRMPSSLNTIGARAFYMCSRLTEIEIPESVTSIGDRAFSNSGLKRIYICADEVAKKANGISAFGYLLDGAVSIVVRSDIANVSAYIQQNYPNVEEITYNDTEYVSYSTHAHSWSEHQELIQRIDCVQDGCMRYVCGDCGIYKDVIIFRHDLIKNAAKEPDCLNIGWHAYVTCSRCDYTTYEEVAAMGHDEITHEAKDPTCTEVGWHAYVTCSRCDYTTYEEVAAMGHDEITHEAKDPTCTEVGWHAYVTCSRCDYTTYKEILAIGHSYTDKICVNCGEDQPPSYSWDISANSDGSVMAHCYALTDGNYLMEIVGSGKMKDWTDTTPWQAIRDRIIRIIIEEGVTSIGDYAFSYFKNLQHIDIPEGLMTIGNHAFAYGDGLKLIYLPESVDSIGDFAFYDYHALTIILKGADMPSNLGSIWNYGCGYYLNPQNVVVNEDSTYVVDQNGIGYLAKYFGNDNTYALLEKTNGIEVTRIGDFAFERCHQLIMLNIPKRISYIGTYAFRDCKKLTLVFESEKLPNRGDLWEECAYYLAPREVIMQDEFVIVVDKDDTVYLSKYYGNTSHLVIPEYINGKQITHVGNSAFYRNTYLLSVTLPESIISVGDRAFKSAQNLEQINLPNSITQIGLDAFWYCQNLREISLPSSLTTIGSSAFGHCPKLEKINIPAGVTSIGSNAFSNCDKLQVIICESHTIANKLTSLSAQGYLLNNATVLVVPGDAKPTTFLTETYPVAENALIDGEYYVIYSLSEHIWMDSVIVETEECEVDGLIHHTCSNCGVRKDTVIPCHDTIWHNGQTQTCTEVGWHAYETCTRCEYTTYVEIPANGHQFALNSDHTCEICYYSKTPDQPVLEDKTEYSITVRKTEGFEYSIDGVNWQDSPVFENLLPDSIYTVYQRVKGSAMAQTSGKSPALTVRTDKEITYTVVFQDWDGRVISSQTYRYGEIVVAPANPTKEADEVYTYTFLCWDEDVQPCYGDKTYTAEYRSAYIDYIIVFQYEDGTVIAKYTRHYAEALSVPEIVAVPEALGAGYEFAGWDKEVTNCQGNAVYTAVFKKTFVPGDIDGKEGVTDADAIYLLYHTFVPSLYPVDQNCDFNGDGDVTDADAIYLLYHTFVPDIYPIDPKKLRWSSTSY